MGNLWCLNTRKLADITLVYRLRGLGGLAVFQLFQKASEPVFFFSRDIHTTLKNVTTAMNDTGNDINKCQTGCNG